MAFLDQIMNRTHIACYNTNCTYFSMEFMGECLNGTWMSSLYYSMPAVTTLVTMNSDEGSFAAEWRDWHPWSRTMNRSDDHEVSRNLTGDVGGNIVGRSLTGDVGGNIGGAGDSYLSMVLVRFLSSYAQLHRVAFFYILQVTRRFSGGVLTPRMLSEMVFSVVIMAFGMLYYKWKFFGEKSSFFYHVLFRSRGRFFCTTAS